MGAYLSVSLLTIEVHRNLLRCSKFCALQLCDRRLLLPAIPDTVCHRNVIALK
jgi:hypothetical protein